MALYALTTGEVVEFVSKMDSDFKEVEVPVDAKDPKKGMKTEAQIGPGASRFHLKSLDPFLQSYIYDNAQHLTGKPGTTEVGITTRINQTNIEAVRFGLAALPDNFQDRKGKPVKMATQKVSVNGREYSAVKDDVIHSLGLALIQEMAERIREISEVSGEDEKNSASE